MKSHKRNSYNVNREEGTCNLTSMSFKRNSYNGKLPHVGYDNPAVELDDQLTNKRIQSKDGENAQFAMEFIRNPKSHPQSGVSSKETSSVHLSIAEDDDNQSDQNNPIIKGMIFVRTSLSKIFTKHSKILQNLFLILFTIAYFIYFGFALAHDWEKDVNYCHGSRFLFVVTVFAVTLIFYFCVIKNIFGKTIDKNIIKPFSNTMGKMWQQACVRWTIYILLLAAVVIFIVMDSVNNRKRLVSASGIIILTLFGFIFSKHPGHVVWRQVFWGLGLQFIFALLILRWNIGRDIFQCLGDKISYFLNFNDQGSSFLFGYLVTGKLNDWSSAENENTNATLPFDGKLPLQYGIFAFKVLPVIFFFSSCISILYHYGIMQWIVMKLGWLLQVTVGTTAAESINAAANIFVGQTEAPLVIQPFLPMMTKSELHAVMTGGFATIAGGVLAAYINFGVSASHLLSASVMSAPAALGFSKLFYPEIEKSNTRADNIKMDKGPERNALEAAANGAANATFLVANIAANLIAFISLIAFINFSISWFGSLIGYDFLSFEWILSKVFIPLAYIMGVDWAECESVAKLIGLKTVVNEFVAYAELGIMLKNEQLSPRAEAIATYALCGFSNLSSIGVQLGGLGAMAPERRSDLAEIAVRGLIAGSVACFLTACIAGTLIDGK